MKCLWETGLWPDHLRVPTHQYPSILSPSLPSRYRNTRNKSRTPLSLSPVFDATLLCSAGISSKINAMFRGEIAGRHHSVWRQDLPQALSLDSTAKNRRYFVTYGVIESVCISRFQGYRHKSGKHVTSAIATEDGSEAHRPLKANPSCHESLNLSIPRIDDLASLPKRALLVFSNGKEECSAVLSSECRNTFFRKGVATDADSKASLIHQHMREDPPPFCSRPSSCL